jgi:hypothetical protein
MRNVMWNYFSEPGLIYPRVTKHLNSNGSAGCKRQQMRFLPAYQLSATPSISAVGDEIPAKLSQGTLHMPTQAAISFQSLVLGHIY